MKNNWEIRKNQKEAELRMVKLLEKIYPEEYKLIKRIAEDERFFDKDFDIIGHHINGGMHLFEVKNDEQISKYGNIYAEFVVYYADGSIDVGWLNKSVADYMLYIDKVNDKTYLFELNDLRTYIIKNNPQIKSSPDFAEDENGNEYLMKYVIAYLVPIKDFMKYTTVYEINNKKYLETQELEQSSLLRPFHKNKRRKEDNND